jgi:hypothetical protein
MIPSSSHQEGLMEARKRMQWRYEPTVIPVEHENPGLSQIGAVVCDGVFSDELTAQCAADLTISGHRLRHRSVKHASGCCVAATFTQLSVAHHPFRSRLSSVQA